MASPGGSSEESAPAAGEGEQVFTFGKVRVTGVASDVASSVTAIGADGVPVDASGGAGGVGGAGGEAAGEAGSAAAAGEGQGAGGTGVDAGGAAGGGGEEQEEPVAKHVTPADVAPIDPSHDWFEYVGTRGVKVTKIGSCLEPMTKLEHLSLRSNKIVKMGGVENLTTLQHLDLYDNQLAKLKGTERLTLLTVLDLSFNAIRVVPDLSHLSVLEELYLANNKLTAIAGVSELRVLRKLDLGANRIRRIEGLGGLAGLKELWLGKNKITEIGAGLCSLLSLQRLSVQSNRLEAVGGLGGLAQLEELYLSHNGIAELDAASLPAELSEHLNTLDISVNRLRSFDHIAHLSALTDLWANGNRVDSFGEVEKLVPLRRLETIYLEHNPLANDFEYRKRVAATLPPLQQIDADPCVRLEAPTRPESALLAKLDLDGATTSASAGAGQK
jgi:protein phosphatase 1 regulatory subunit 7